MKLGWVTELFNIGVITLLRPLRRELLLSSDGYIGDGAPYLLNAVTAPRQKRQ